MNESNNLQSKNKLIQNTPSLDMINEFTFPFEFTLNLQEEYKTMPDSSSYEIKEMKIMSTPKDR